jgi:DNA-binding NtrC family response regulator
MIDRGGAFDLGQHLIGDSRAMQELRAVVARLAPTRLAVLIHGPTGAGKELVAQALHVLSHRTGRFVPVNVAAVPDAMFEDEFFGHVRGAFTGAIRDRSGLLTEAHRGTLFLDEVGSFSATAQPKLLRVLETQLFRPVGARADQRSEFRTLAATNEELEDLIGAQRFRRDLRRRLAECVVYVPPLVDRREDIGPLAQHFAQRVTSSRAIVITPDARRLLQSYDWPDNVRELRQTIECALALGDGMRVDANVLCAALGTRAAARPTVSSGEIALDRQRLVQVLEECDWNTATAAERIGVNRSTIYRRMWRFGVKSPASGDLHDLREADANLREARANGANAAGDTTA